jgi:hypothetical protein
MAPVRWSIDGVAGCAIDMISILKNNVKKSRLSKLRLKENVQVGEAKPFKKYPCGVLFRR